MESNLKFLLEDINSIRPKREGKFVTRVLLKCAPGSEQLKIDPFLYIPEQAVRKPSSKAEPIEEREMVENVN